MIENIDYQQWAESTSEKYSNAKKAGTRSTNLFHCLFIKNQGCGVHKAYVHDINQNAVLFYIPGLNMVNWWGFKDDKTVESFFVENEKEAHFIFKEEKGKNQKFNLGNINNLAQMNQLASEIEKDEKVKTAYLGLKFLETVDLAVGTTETIPIDLYTRVYRTEKDLDIVKKSTGQESEWETIEEESDSAQKEEKDS